ncbi:MAG: chromosome segregation protein SMC, partial [Acidobacteria bacterium]|nr:chromosome segregation protein SMC [Acidobacteriota bacterium]
MLRLKRVELQGFKSFCDRSDMRFHGTGITAIVGPNGCGKSNLSDAISWVLGEQSAKSLRGVHMADVIFAGTRERKPLGMATVSLTMVDPSLHAEFPLTYTNGQSEPNGHANGHANGYSHHADAKTGEITITRRLFRSGESEYLINGRIARLRDIQELFMGTGLGPESYAIIEQGRIGQILSTKPQDRRNIIEEAAGITKFKTRKRLAEAKLESARQNLTRVFDILEEVGRQANSLKRQASKARRFGELKAEMTAQLRRALAGRYRMVEREAARSALDLNAAIAGLQSIQAQVAEKEKEQTAAQEHSWRTEAELTEARRVLAELRLEAERTRGRLETQASQIAGIEQRLSEGEAESRQLEKRFADLQLELSAHSGRLRELEQQSEAARATLAGKNAERERLQADLRERESGIESARQQVLRLLGEASSLKNQLAQLDQYLIGIERDTARLHKEEESASAEIERLDIAKRELSARMSARQLELLSTAEQRLAVDQELKLRKDSEAACRARLEELRQETSRLKARRDSLEEILSHRAYTTESVKCLFTAIERGRAHLKPLGVLADFVEVETAYEKAAEEFLHEELEYVVVQNWGEAGTGIDLMRTDLDGRVTFLVHPSPDHRFAKAPVAEPAIGPETGILGRLSGFLRMTNGLTHAPAELLPRLARCFLAGDRAAAQRLALQYPDVYFLLPDGVCYHGHAVSGGRKTGSGPLALKRELREITSLATSRNGELERTRAQLAGLEAEIAQLSEQLEHVRAEQQTQEKDALALDHEMRKLADEFSRANSRLSVARLDLQRLLHDAAKSKEHRERTRELVDQKEEARAGYEQTLTGARAALESVQQQAAHVSEEHATLRAQLAGLEERCRGEQAARGRIETHVRDATQRRDNLAAESERLGSEKARLMSNNVALDARAAELAGRITEGEAAEARMADAEALERQQLAALEEALRQMRIDVQAAGERRSQAELELVKRQAELKYLDETCRKELGLGVEDLAGLEAEIPGEDTLAEAEQRCQELRVRIEALGPVNTEAVEQFEEAQQRYDFLNTQRQDLLDSIRDTEKAIQEIDRESRKRFSEAFEHINANFRETFKVLFGGGTGEMRLTDPENLADSGIDIVASPPGKRLQSVLLLSGGERALTAMALLMAIFQYQPSPFCVLDEV